MGKMGSFALNDSDPSWRCDSPEVPCSETEDRQSAASQISINSISTSVVMHAKCSHDFNVAWELGIGPSAMSVILLELRNLVPYLAAISLATSNFRSMFVYLIKNASGYMSAMIVLLGFTEHTPRTSSIIASVAKLQEIKSLVLVSGFA